MKSGGDFEDILAADNPDVWQSNRPAKGGEAGAMLATIIERAARLKAGKAPAPATKAPAKAAQATKAAATARANRASHEDVASSHAARRSRREATHLLLNPVS